MVEMPARGSVYVHLGARRVEPDQVAKMTEPFGPVARVRADFDVRGNLIGLWVGDAAGVDWDEKMGDDEDGRR